jgi:hypothetical protein
MTIGGRGCPPGLRTVSENRLPYIAAYSAGGCIVQSKSSSPAATVRAGCRNISAISMRC